MKAWEKVDKMIETQNMNYKFCEYNSYCVWPAKYKVSIHGVGTVEVCECHFGSAIRAQQASWE